MKKKNINSCNLFKLLMNLAEFGFTKYESMVYVSLLKEGLSTAHEISKKSQVPYGKIYVVLASLVEKNQITKYDGIPQKFSAIDPQVVLAENLRKKEQQLLEYKQKSQRMISQLSKLSVIKENESLDKIKTIQGYKNYLNLSIKLHEEAQHTWCSISELSTYQPHLEAYEKSIKRGIKVKMLVSLPEANEEKIALWKSIGVNLRGVDLQTTKYSIIDDTQVTIRLTKEKKYLSLWIKNPALNQMLKSHFDSLWEHAKPL